MQNGGLPFGEDLIRQPYRANEEQYQQFVRGVTAVLNQWTALHLVAQHCDPKAFPALHEELLEWHLQDGEVYSDELELFFENFYNSARHVLIEDDSQKEVSDLIHDMYCRCCNNDYSVVEQYCQSEVLYRQQNPLALCVNATTTEEELDDAMENYELADEQLQEGGAANEEDEAPEPVEQKLKKKKKKNAFQRGKDGWSTVL